MTERIPSRKIPYIQIMRVLAIAGVLCAHSPFVYLGAFGAFGKAFERCFMCFGTVGVPVFFAISGYLFDTQGIGGGI